ncbi:MAG: type IV toxin-antitoxin system AbiEi family antitoxin domain-containing protein [Jatrophihabitantaceae bacterium]
MTRIELERAIVDLAEGQWGLLTAAQARLAGVSRVQLTRLVDAGMLVRLVHGVYVLRGAAGIEYLELRAAWLGLDPERMAADRLRNRTDGAVVSHASAARLHQLGDLDADRHEFTLADRKQSRRSDVRLHRGILQADDVAVAAGLPVTKPGRVVVDLLADRHDGEHVSRVLAGAVASRSIDLERLAPRLGPFAARFGFPAGEGKRVLDHLLELGGAADQVAAEDLVRIARTHNLGVAEIVWAGLSVQVTPNAVEAAQAALSTYGTRNAVEAAQAALGTYGTRNAVEAAQAALSPIAASRPTQVRRARKAIEGTSA